MYKYLVSHFPASYNGHHRNTHHPLIYDILLKERKNRVCITKVFFAVIIGVVLTIKSKRQ